ncbi:ArsR/SmtB family transcription factor [Blastococcus saxobsidens]|uniref:ArsR family transcriptional regulator n=1 Tax=Blastococcus saxobsidens TaxID=138336 RepID=A0A4V2G1Y4_9ACTN|nr:metalloregulator ArsR/SmtB family transcription factor [Blastococcus saxobsidens]RZU31076.1 ArsR family transcriptional regulator [Blastococcus saxobsidens]
MVVDQLDQQSVDRVFAALADATRRDIVTRVMAGESSVSALARNYEMSFAAVQKHVAVLERARLVSKERRGREQIVRGDVGTVRAAARLLGGFEELWRARIGRIDDLLAAAPGDAR